MMYTYSVNGEALQQGEGRCGCVSVVVIQTIRLFGSPWPDDWLFRPLLGVVVRPPSLSCCLSASSFISSPTTKNFVFSIFMCFAVYSFIKSRVEQSTDKSEEFESKNT